MISCICKAQLVQLNFYLVGHVRDANTSNSTAGVTVTRPVDSACQCHRCGRPWPSPAALFTLPGLACCHDTLAATHYIKVCLLESVRAVAPS